MENAIVERNGTGLTKAEAKTLAQHEATIEKGIDTFYEVGEALCAIRDGRLYRQTHDSFEDYCRDRWDMSRIHAHRLITANEIREELLPIGNILPANEFQARALAGIPEEDRQAVWERVVEEAPVNAAGRPAITARMIEETAEVIAWEKLSPKEREFKEAEDRIRQYARTVDSQLRGTSLSSADEGKSYRRCDKRAMALESQPSTKEEYFDKRDAEDWEREWAERKAKEEQEEKELKERRRIARPYLNIIANARSLKYKIREHFRQGIVYRFRIENYDYKPPERRGSWPPQYAEVAIGILEELAKEIRAEPDKFFLEPPTHPWQHDEDNCELDCKWDEIDYDQSAPCPPSKRTSMTKKGEDLSTTEATR